jgi:hypothetical protein
MGLWDSVVHRKTCTIRRKGQLKVGALTRSKMLSISLQTVHSLLNVTRRPSHPTRLGVTETCLIYSRTALTYHDALYEGPQLIKSR